MEIHQANQFPSGKEREDDASGGGGAVEEAIVAVDKEGGTTVGFAFLLREGDARGGETVMVHDRHFIDTLWERPDRADMLQTRSVDPKTRASIARTDAIPRTMTEMVEASCPLTVSEIGALIVLQRCQRCNQFVSP